MSDHQAILRQVASAETLQTVVTTMKTLASVRIGRYRRAVAALDASSKTLERAMQALVSLYPALLRGRSTLEAPSLAVIVFGSDRGLCGPFNHRVARHAGGLLQDRAPAGARPALLAIGRRVERELEARGWEVEHRVRTPGNFDGVETATRGVLSQIDAWRSDGRATDLILVHNRPTSGARYRTVARQLLPLDEGWLRSLRDRPWPSNRRPMILSEERALLEGLVRQLVANGLVRAFAASQASENAARLAAMEAAEDNIDERLTQLRRAYRSARQQAITEELLDIQAAYAAARRDHG